MRCRVLLLPVRARQPPRPGDLQGAGGDLPARPEKEAAQEARQEGALAAQALQVHVRLRRVGAPVPPSGFRLRVGDQRHVA